MAAEMRAHHNGEVEEEISLVGRYANVMKKNELLPR